MTTYTLFEHRHRFAVWAGARAAQRAFTSVENLRDALEATDVRAYLENPDSLQADAMVYKSNHRRWCNQIVEFLLERGVADATFGRAAKLVAVYFKAMVITGPHAHTSLAASAHPPVDRVLLQNLAGSPKIRSQHKRAWRAAAWTRLSETQYYELIDQIREILPHPEPWWKLEEYWTVTNE